MISTTNITKVFESLHGSEVASVACRAFPLIAIVRRALHRRGAPRLVVAIEVRPGLDPSAGVPKGAAELRVRSVEKHRELEASPAVAVEVVLTHGVEELGSDAYSLPLGHYYKSRRPVSLGREQRRDCKMTYGLAVDDADKVFCGHRERKV